MLKSALYVAAFNLLFLVPFLVMEGCGDKTASLDNKLGAIQTQATQMNQSMDEINSSTSSMAKQLTTLVDILDKLTGAVQPPKALTQPTSYVELAGFNTQAAADTCCTDLTIYSIEDLTVLRNEVQSALTFSSLSHVTIPKVLDLIKSLKICAVDGNVDSQKAELIAEIGSLIQRL